MKLIAEGASSMQIAAGQIAATTFLEACGVTMDEVRWAWSIYERWAEGCSGPNDRSLKEGAEIRSDESQMHEVDTDGGLHFESEIVQCTLPQQKLKATVAPLCLRFFR